MCFSAEASFALSAVLVPAGIYCAVIAFRRHFPHLIAAAIPVAFGAQQICEGFVWIGLHGDTSLIANASLMYLFFALMFWPMWIPLTRTVLEGRRQHRLIVGMFLFLGVAVGLGLFLPVVAYPETLGTVVAGHSLRYEYE